MPWFALSAVRHEYTVFEIQADSAEAAVERFTSHFGAAILAGDIMTGSWEPDGDATEIPSADDAKEMPSANAQ